MKEEKAGKDSGGGVSLGDVITQGEEPNLQEAGCSTECENTACERAERTSSLSLSFKLRPERQRSAQTEAKGEAGARSHPSLQAGRGVGPSLLPKLVKDSRQHLCQLIHGRVHVPWEKPHRS